MQPSICFIVRHSMLQACMPTDNAERPLSNSVRVRELLCGKEEKVGKQQGVTFQASFTGVWPRSVQRFTGLKGLLHVDATNTHVEQASD